MKQNSNTSHHITNKLSKWGFAILLIALFTTLQPAPAAHAATISVNSTDDVIADDGQCTLREAITAANTDTASGSSANECISGNGDDIITFSSAGTTLSLTGTENAANGNDNTVGDLDIDSNITISGNGAGVTIIDGGDIDRVLHTHGTAIVNLNNLTIQNGQIGTLGDNSSSGSFGGGIYRQSSGDMVLDTVEILSNVAGHRGGGLENRNAAGTVTLINCTVSANESLWGGGLVSATANAETIITNSTFSNNVASIRGGGVNIYAGTVTVENSVFTSNTTIENTTTQNDGESNGGGLANSDHLTISSSTIISNTAYNYGGGVYTRDGDDPSVTTILSSTIAFNDAPGSADNDHNGGGTYINSGTLNITNSTISGNTAANNGAGIFIYGVGNAAAAVVSNSTIANNNGVGSLGSIHVVDPSASITLHNSIVSNNGVNCDNSGIVTDGGNNLEFPYATCGGFTVQTDPLLGALADNGGSTETHALLVGSPAIDAGNSCTTNDQRGMSRAVDGDGDSVADCDIGAYEAGEMQCAIGVDTYTFGTQSNVEIEITVDGSDLDCLYVDERKTHHPNATSGGSGAGIETNTYWVINGLNSSFLPAALDYTFSLTLPFTGADNDSRVCKWINGAGYGWNCGVDADNTPGTNIVTRTGLNSFSEWAVGDHVGPTAVSLQSITTTNPSSGWVILLFSILLLTAGGLWLQRTKH